MKRILNELRIQVLTDIYSGLIVNSLNQTSWPRWNNLSNILECYNSWRPQFCTNQNLLNISQHLKMVLDKMFKLCDSDGLCSK